MKPYTQEWWLDMRKKAKEKNKEELYKFCEKKFITNHAIQYTKMMDLFSEVSDLYEDVWEAFFDLENPELIIIDDGYPEIFVRKEYIVKTSYLVTINGLSFSIEKRGDEIEEELVYDHGIEDSELPQIEEAINLIKATNERLKPVKEKLNQ